MDIIETKNLTEEEVRLHKLEKLRTDGINPFTYVYDKTHNIEEILEKYKDLEQEERAAEVVSIAGRIIAKRGHGKATFGNILDETGKIQYYANIQTLGEDSYKQLLSLDVGDIIGIKGQPFITKRGELSIALESYQLLTKSLKPLPEKYHGLQDKELRYRHRYVDLIANPDVRTVFKSRSNIIWGMRQWLTEKGFMEVETPVLHSIYGGAAARPFKTFHNELEQNLYLRIATELHLKRLIVGGFEKVYEIGRIFRNEGVSYKHNPEFTSIELYQAYTDYNGMMDLTEQLISYLVYKLHNTYKIEYQGNTLDFTPPFKRLKMEDALKENAGIDFSTDLEALRKKAQELGLEITGKEEKGELIAEIYDAVVEPKLIQPTFILDYPWETSPLAKRKRNNNDLVERFELIVNSMELANAFSELNDPIDQYARFEDQLKAKATGYEDAHEMDEDYVNALRYGMPPTGGLGIGIDRLVMILTNQASIRDVLFFPHMREK